MVRLKKYSKVILKFLTFFFALIGVGLTAGFFAVKWHLTDIPGMIDLNDRKLSTQNALLHDAFLKTNTGDVTGKYERMLQNWCRLGALKKYSPETNIRAILSVFFVERDEELTARMIDAASLQTSTSSYSALQNAFIACTTLGENTSLESSSSTFLWANTEEWRVFKAAIAADADLINHIAKSTEVEPRLIVAQLLSEQMRLFYSERAMYKQFFAPLKILGNETQFSLGVTGMKEETAAQIEKNLKDSGSVFYLGPTYEHMLDFTTTNPTRERIERIADEHNHSYAYLYTALYLKQIMTQWKNAGYDISDRPEILSTLFNIGFQGSKPNANPHVGGSSITIAGKEYTFGSLGYEFYYSGELMDEFPYSHYGT